MSEAIYNRSLVAALPQVRCWSLSRSEPDPLVATLGSGSDYSAGRRSLFLYPRVDGADSAFLVSVSPRSKTALGSTSGPRVLLCTTSLLQTNEKVRSEGHIDTCLVVKSHGHKLFCLGLVYCVVFLTGAAQWQKAVHAFGLLVAAAGVLLMLLTAWKSFGAAEFEGQVYKHELSIPHRDSM